MRSESGHKSSARRLGKIVAAALSAALIVGGMQSSSADEGYDELARFPGLGIPDPRVAGTWVTPQQSGLAYMKKSRQWTRTPTLQSVAFNRATQRLQDPTCSRITQAPGSKDFREWWADVVLVDRGTALDSPRRYGFTQSFVVRTVAFGSVPVEATVALEQARNAKNVVIPTTLKQKVATYCAGQGDFEIPPPDSALAVRYFAVAGGGQLRVRVDRLVVDGIPLSLSGCTADGANLSLTSREYLKWDSRIPDEDRPGQGKEAIIRTKYFSINQGGLLLGSLNIPAFAGCVTTGGDDLSPLLTATVSGDDNAVEIRTEGTDRSADDGGVTDEFEVCPFVRNCADRFPAPELPTASPS